MNFRKLFTTIIGAASISLASAQSPGPNCLSAVSVPGSGISSVFTQSSPNGWLSFVANEANKVVALSNAGGASDFKIKKLTVAAGTCNSLTPLGSDTMDAGDDTLLVVNLTGLTIGNTYFLRTVMQTGTDCPTCNSPGQAFFRIGISTTITPCNACPTPTCNMVCNGGFESISALPTGPSYPLGQDEVLLACNWSSALNTPDLFNTGSAPSTQVSIPTNAYGCNPINTAPGTGGNSFAGFVASGPGGPKEAVKTMFTSPMNAFSTYEITLWLSLAEGSGANANSVSIDFLDASGNMMGYAIRLDGSSSPGIYNTFPSVLTATTGWTKFTVIYTAGSAPTTEYGIAIGGLSLVTSTVNYPHPYQAMNSSFVCAPVSPGPGAYYFLDDVSVTEIPQVIATASSVICSGDPLTLSATGPAGNYVWMPGNLSGQSVTTTALAGTTTYTVTFTDPAGCYASSSANVTVTAGNCCTNPLTFNSIIFSNVTLIAAGTNVSPSPKTLWMNVVYGGSYTGYVEIPPNGIMPSANYSIRGNLVVNSSSSNPTVFTGSDMVFDDCSNLDQKTALIIDKSYLHSCNHMWQGISSQKYLAVTNSIIEDAVYGIGIGIASHPGLLVDNDVFNKNRYGILLLGAANFNTASPNNFKITGTIFTCKTFPSTFSYSVPLNYNFTSSTLIGANNTVKGTFTTMKGGSCSAPATRSETGIFVFASTVSSGTYFNIGNTSGGTNYFSYLNQGIYNTGSKIYVVNSNFQQIINSSGNVGIAGIVHDGGIAGTETNVGDLNSSVKSCKFQTSEMGIKAFKGGKLNVYSSNFNTAFSSTTGIDVENWGDPNGAVNILQNNFNNCTYADLRAVTNNSIKLIMQGNTSIGNGLYNVNIQESGSPNALYRIDGNDFSDRQSGIYLNGLFNANITDNTINIASNNSNGSTFTSGIWNYNCKSCLFSGNNISSTNPNSNNSKYYVVGIFTDGSNGNTYCSNAISKVGECMKFQQNCLPSNIYSNSFNASGPSAINAILLQTAVVGNIGVSSGTTWYASENIFGNFSFPEVYSVTSPGATYYDITSPTFGGSTLYVFGLTSKIPGGPVCPSATFRLNSDSLPHHPPVFDPSAKDYLKEEYYIARMYEQYRHILPDSVMNACAAGNIGKFFVADSLMQLYVNSKDLSYLAQANAVNSSVVPQNVIESNQVRLNNILQSYLLNESAAMAGYLDDLRVLAQKCPATDGNCVYQARALLSVYDRTEYTSECERGSEISTNNNSSVDGNVHVYPNPASNEVFVNVSKEGLKIEVYNILGVKVSSYVLAQGENKLDVSKLSSGTYFFKVMDSSSLVKVEKVIIDHQ